MNATPNMPPSCAHRTAEQLDKYEAALRLIAGHRDMTLMSAYGVKEYSDGAHAAFVQLAGIAAGTLGE